MTINDFSRVYAATKLMRWRPAGKSVVLVLAGVLVGLSITQILLQDMATCSNLPPLTRQMNSAVGKTAPSVPNRLYSTTASSAPGTHSTSKKPNATSHSSFRRIKDKVVTEGVRPKTIKQELKLREPLYVGVVTANSLLDTRATAVNRTWGQLVPKLEFFSSEGEQHHNLPIVSLPGVDDTYPPQKKVYRMLQYMHDHYIDKYDWFMRADDDSYIRIPELLEFLSKLDPNEDLYIGSPGMGREEDLERIKLLSHERYCMGGPGVIFSRALLIRLAPHLDDCLENVVVSYNEDLEVGRCVSRRLQVQCTWSYEVSSFGLKWECSLPCIFSCRCASCSTPTTQKEPF